MTRKVKRVGVTPDLLARQLRGYPFTGLRPDGTAQAMFSDAPADLTVVGAYWDSSTNMLWVLCESESFPPVDVAGSYEIPILVLNCRHEVVPVLIDQARIERLQSSYSETTQELIRAILRHESSRI